MYVIVLFVIIIYYIYVTRMQKPETFIDSVKVIDMFKYTTPRDFIKALGSKENVTKTFIRYQIPQEYIANPVYYPKIASYIYTESKKNRDPLLEQVNLAP
jgi:hypothetical protein